MCLLSFLWQPQSPQPLVMVANRDEFHDRPARQSQFWPEHPHLLAGKDLKAGGTWMGVTRDGRFAALTNVRRIPSPYQGSISRGRLVLDFLNTQASPSDYLQQVAAHADQYDGFNLILGNTRECWYLSNYALQYPEHPTPASEPSHTGADLSISPVLLSPGLYGLSNAQLNAPWPKVEYAKAQLQHWQNARTADALNSTMSSDTLAQQLHRRATFPANTLPDTGIGAEWETLLSSPFIISPHYGTRVSTGLILNAQSVDWCEVTYQKDGSLLEKRPASFDI